MLIQFTKSIRVCIVFRLCWLKWRNNSTGKPGSSLSDKCKCVRYSGKVASLLNLLFVQLFGSLYLFLINGLKERLWIIGIVTLVHFCYFIRIHVACSSIVISSSIQSNFTGLTEGLEAGIFCFWGLIFPCFSLQMMLGTLVEILLALAFPELQELPLSCQHVAYLEPHWPYFPNFRQLHLIPLALGWSNLRQTVGLNCFAVIIGFTSDSCSDSLHYP